MNGTIIKYGVIALAVGGFLAWGAYQDSKPQTADLGQVLDRAEYALENYQPAGDVGAEVTDAQMQDFTIFMTDVMNVQPSFYDTNLGMELKEDAVFMGYTDGNFNRTRDADEKDVFKLEIDTEGSRLIATDMTGDSVHKGFSGTGLIAGLILGNILARQTRAGVNRNSFASRQTKPRNSYTASSTARSKSRAGGSRAGK